MSFGPTNAPPFYSAMMSDLEQQWDVLFLEELQKESSTGDFKINFISRTQIFFDNIWLEGYLGARNYNGHQNA